MYKEYFYEHNDFNLNEVEDLIASREHLYAPIIEKLIARKELTLEEHKTLIEFRHITYYRSNEFIGFHTHRKDRGEGSSQQRLDWLRLNGIYGGGDREKDIKRSQLKAIQDVINRKDAAYRMSSLTPFCYAAAARDKKFAIGDNGSISMGEEFDGVTIIVISPDYALVFPKARTALEIMEKTGVTAEQSTVKYLQVGDEYVEPINRRILDRAFEYYIDPNL